MNLTPGRAAACYRAMMKRLPLACLSFLFACGDSEAPKADAAPEAAKTGGTGAAAPTAATGPFQLGKDEKLTAENLEKLFQNVATCKFDSTGAGLTSCPADKWIYDATHEDSHGDSDTRRKLEREVALKMLKDASPQVRFRAADLVIYREDSRADVADAALKEQDPNARVAMATRVVQMASADAASKKAWLAFADDKEPRIRRETAYQGKNIEDPAVLEKLVAMAEGDADEQTRATACRAVGYHADAAKVKWFEKMLVAATPPQVYDRCLIGLTKMWLEDENANKDAYKLSLKLLGKGPFRPAAPSVEISNDFGDLPAKIKESPDAWKKKTFVKVPEIGAALLSTVKAKDADPYLREALVEALPKYGVKKKDLVAVRKSLPKTLPENLQSLAKKLDDTIATLKK